MGTTISLGRPGCGGGKREGCESCDDMETVKNKAKDCQYL